MRKLSHVTILDEYVVDINVVLGQGSTGCVYQGSNTKTGEKVAIKVIDLCTIDNEVASYLLAMEKNALMIVSNPYILKGLKVAQDNRYCFMVTEFCNGGTLKK
jgi:calcium-dependent protein kinase